MTNYVETPVDCEAASFTSRELSEAELDEAFLNNPELFELLFKVARQQQSSSRP